MLYEVDEDFLNELQKAEEENLLPSGDDITKEEVKERIKKRSYVIANKTAELDALANLEKEIKQKKNTIKNTIEFLKQADEKDIYFLYGDDIDKAKKETKGYLNFRKSVVTDIPQEVEELINQDKISGFEITDTETGEVTFSNEYIDVKVNRKIKKEELKKVLGNSEVKAVTTDGSEYKIQLKENINIKVPNVII